MMSSLRSAQQGPELTPVTISPNNHPDLTFNYTEKGDSEEVNHKSKTNLKYIHIESYSIIQSYTESYNVIQTYLE